MNKIIFSFLCVFFVSMPLFAISETDNFSSNYDNYVAPYFENNGVKGSFSGVNGVNIAYVKFEKNNEAGAIVLVHGKGENYEKYAEFVYDLRNSGYSIYLMTMRGHGQSGRMTIDPFKVHIESFNYYVDDLKTFVDTVVKTKPHNRLFLMSHSTGGCVSALYLEKYPNDFRAAVFCSPMLQIRQPIGTEESNIILSTTNVDLGLGAAYALGQGPAIVMFPMESLDNDKTTHSQARYDKQQALRQYNWNYEIGSKISGGAQWGPTWNWVRESLLATRNARTVENLSKIKIPVLILQAGDDNFVMPEAQNTMAQTVSDSRLVRFGTDNTTYNFSYNGFHELLMEKDEIRDVAMGEIMNFLNSK